MTVEEAPNVAADPALRWTIQERGDGRGLRVCFAGEIDENADLSELKAQLSGDVEFQLDGVTRINSCGVREWVNFVREMGAVSSLRFTRCSPAIVTQLNTIYNFRGPARVWSLYAPYVCEACSVEESKLIDVRNHRPGAPPALPDFSCPKCGGPMDFDDIPERYFSFLKEA